MREHLRSLDLNLIHPLRARLLEALAEYQKRERRYGGIGEGDADTHKPARASGE